jgi:hypothetical protein
LLTSSLLLHFTKLAPYLLHITIPFLFHLTKLAPVLFLVHLT